MNFYSYKLSDVLETTTNDFLDLVKAMKIIKARDRLIKCEEISYPHMKENDRKDLHKRMYKEANPEYFEEKITEVKLSDLPRVLGNMYGR